MTTKEAITNKLFEALKELQLRSKDSPVAKIQRMFGVVLGLRMALMELNKVEGAEPYSFAGYLGVLHLINDKFGEKTLAEIRAYEFPAF